MNVYSIDTGQRLFFKYPSSVNKPRPTEQEQNFPDEWKNCFEDHFVSFVEKKKFYVYITCSYCILTW